MKKPMKIGVAKKKKPAPKENKKPGMPMKDKMMNGKPMAEKECM